MTKKIKDVYRHTPESWEVSRTGEGLCRLSIEGPNECRKRRVRVGWGGLEVAALTLMPSQEKSVRVCCRREERGWYLGTYRSAILTSSEGLPESHREEDLPEAEKDLSV